MPNALKLTFIRDFYSNIMIAELKSLSKLELELLIKAPLLVSILIGGADGEIDRSEIEGAIAAAQKMARSKSSLKAYYESVLEDFEDKLKVIIQDYPSKPEKRGEEISEELAGLNIIFNKVEGALSLDIYESLKSLAHNIAKSSGGFFGMKSIGVEEARYVELKMILPPTTSR